MGYQLIDTDEIEPMPDRPSTGIEISDHFDNVEGDEPTRGPRKMGLRVYVVEPGEQIGLGYHYHETQEEVFYTIEGTLHVDTPEGEYRVEPDQAFLVEPNSPQLAFNPEDAEDAVRVLAVGAPSYSVLGRNDAQPYDPEADEPPG